MNNKICQMITDRLTAEMEKGIIPWERPWTASGGAISHSTGKPYSLLNQFLLVKPGEYLTYNQVNAEGGKVRKGERSKFVVFWKQVAVDTDDVDESGKPVKKFVPMLRYYNVFHIDQCEGIEAKYPVEERKILDPVAEAEAIVENYEAAESVKGLHVYREDESGEAYYSPARDCVVVPQITQYSNIAEYYSTLFHEMTHSTGHASRLSRFSGSAENAAFGGEEYSKEELIAEIGAASLNSYCGIETASSFKNSTAYIQSWLRALKNDATMIVAAAGKAEKAVNYILGAG